MNSSVKLALLAGLIVVGSVISGCGSARWNEEFVARLEGVSAAIEEAHNAFIPKAYVEDQEHDFRVVANLGRELLFKGALIEKLQPPAGCVEIQEKSLHTIGSLGRAYSDYNFEKSATPYLIQHTPADLEREVSALSRLISEAEGCE